MTDYWRDFYQLHSETGGYQRRIQQARSLVADFLVLAHHPYAAFSGGKDSTVMLALLAEAGRTDVPVFTQLDDLDWSFTPAHCQTVTDRLGFTRHQFVTTAYSVRGRVSSMTFTDDRRIDTDACFFDEIDQYIASHQYTAAAIGIRAEESRKRRMVIGRMGPVFTQRDGLVKGFPLAYLTGEDVFAYIVSHDLPYAPTYDAHGDKAPHQMRFSWICNPDFFSRGNLVWLRQHFPEEYYQLSKANPYVRTHV